MAHFNFFAQNGAFTRNAQTGTYRVNFDKMEQAMNLLSEKILTLQGNSDYEGVKKLLAELGKTGPELQQDLNRLGQAEIPVDVVFEQGKEALGL